MILVALLAILVPQTEVPATVTIFPGQSLGVMPRDSMGLSYEALQLTDPNFFSPENKSLIALCKRLSPKGVLRIGGNSSELSWWKPAENAQPPAEIIALERRAGPWTNRKAYAITPRAIDNLAGFLRASGWTLIYGLNFGAGSPASDPDEAAYVAKKVGARLKYFQIGNEPDLYATGDNGARPKGWGFPEYVKEWLAIADAVSERVKGARFGGPDVAGSSDWVARFGEAVGPRLGDRLASLSGHYYAMGPAGAPSSTVEHMLSPQPRIAESMKRIVPVAQRLGTTYRMTEGNSCYRGGQAGVSNALAAALWGGDYILEMASLGGAGVNFHGGGGAQIGASLGNHLPGARNASDLEVAKLGSFYSPIAGSREAGFSARPIFYGMMLAERFAGQTLLKTELSVGEANVTAYAARVKGGYLLALFNKDLAKDLRFSVNGVPVSALRIWRLTGPSLGATESITFAAAAPPADLSIAVPHGSAVLVLIAGNAKPK